MFQFHDDDDDAEEDDDAELLIEMINDDADRDDVTLLLHTVVSLEYALLCDHHFMERLMIDLSS